MPDNGHARKAYLEKYKDPRWQKLRLEIFNRDNWTCQCCGDTENTLHVHHRYYRKNTDPWEYPINALVTLCEECHRAETELRYIPEQMLLHTLREMFFTPHLIQLILIFTNISLEYTDSQLFISKIEQLITDKDQYKESSNQIYKILKDRYMRYGI